ncbi:uncharacterized protein C2orf72 homolog isoform X1 [Anguilla rostrata]|uniref:uncharacterized protein C2orf72 homolog isoform X1 n=1 Tax=Anguilla anguilla TaxID=7936 RepID=UPI0015ADDAA0|nr:uncharacterized protein C2orf72 homolog isoform X1 [Anguilla anguilla]
MDLQIQNLRDEKSSVEDAFRQTVAEMGGKERIHLVSSVFQPEDVNQLNVFEELVKDLFYDTIPLRRSRAATSKEKPTEYNKCNGKKGNIAARDMKTCCDSSENSVQVQTAENREVPGQNVHHIQTDARLKPAQATIDSQMIIFIFKREFVNCCENHACLKEILKDVRARTKLASIRPALLGLVRTTVENEESELSVVMLESLMRSVFKKHPTESIWVGQFVPNKANRNVTIKKNACRTLQTSLNSECIDNSHNLPLMQKCFPWTPRKKMNSAKISSSYRHQGLPESVEGLPLKTSCMTDEQCKEDQLEPDFGVSSLDGNAEQSPGQPVT